MNVWEVLTETEMIRALEQRGYVIRHGSESRHPLSWNRTAPIPPDVDFKAEALGKLREQIVPEMIHFRVDTLGGAPEIHRAILRVLY